MSDVTRILSQIESGDPSAAEQLLPLIYDELRKLAAAKLANEKPGQTLQATALVHDTYLRLVDQSMPQQWDNRRHFFAAAAEAMRRILIERARQKRSLKAGGEHQELHRPNTTIATNDNGHAISKVVRTRGVTAAHSSQPSTRSPRRRKNRPRRPHSRRDSWEPSVRSGS